MRFALTLATLLTLTLGASGQATVSSRTNILELVNGGVVISASSTYGGNWGALNLADGSTGTDWCSAQRAALPHTIVFELPQPYTITSVAVDNSGDQEAGYPGISSRGVTVYGSTTSATEGFILLTNIEAQKSGRKEVKLDAPRTVHWLKFAVESNWGNAEYTEIMELEAYGQTVGPSPKVNVTGFYQTNYGPMRVEQDGSSISGCYLPDGELSGNLSGRVMQLEWRQDKGKRVGSVVMVLSAKGEALNGVWFENGQLRGEWSGSRSNIVPQCSASKDGAIGARLASTGRAEVYGIYFDSDSATLKPTSEKALNQILQALQAQPTLKLQVEGHTDSTNTDSYNLGLSQHRADAVVSWLAAHSVTASRLTAKGFGKSRPVANNATASGRALNRRVELVAQQ